MFAFGGERFKGRGICYGGEDVGPRWCAKRLIFSRRDLGTRFWIKQFDEVFGQVRTFDQAE